MLPNICPLFDILVLPSFTEGLPIIILEAMQADTPIVASALGGVPEVLGNGRYGLILEPRNPKSLVTQCNILYEGESRYC